MHKKVFVLFVEPMLYGLDMINEVYNKSGFELQYYYCGVGITGKDNLELPNGAVVGSGDKRSRKKKLYKVLDDFRPDFCVVNGYTGIDQTIVIKYCIRKRIPFGIDSDTPLHIPCNPIIALAKKIYLFSIFHHTFCYGIPGGTLQQKNFEYYGIPKERIFIRPMSVSVKRIRKVFEESPSKKELQEKFNLKDKKTVLFVGRLESVKSVDLLIDAFAEVKRKYHEAALLIVGDGFLMNELKNKVDLLKIQDVHFEGYQVFPKLIEYYKVADIFVLPSQFEPWGLVVNEAMICGLPVIVSSRVGCRMDLVEDNLNGFVFESRNETELEKALETMFEMDLKKMSCESLERMNSWNFETYLPLFKKKVNDICENHYQ